MRKNNKRKFNKRFPDITYKKLVLFRNPDEFTSVFIEKVNPDHFGILWGRRRKDLKKGTSYIRWGHIYFSIVYLSAFLSSMAWIDAITGYLYGILLKLTVASFMTLLMLTYCLYLLPIQLSRCGRKVISSC